MLKEFKEFAMRGNVMDMAVGIIIGAAFGKIVSSLVEDVMMPPIGRLVGHLDFSIWAPTPMKVWRRPRRRARPRSITDFS